MLDVGYVCKHRDAEMASSLHELYNVSSLYVMLLVYFEQKCYFICRPKVHMLQLRYGNSCSISGDARVTGIHWISVVVFLKVPNLDSFFEVKTFSCIFLRVFIVLCKRYM